MFASCFLFLSFYFFFSFFNLFLKIVFFLLKFVFNYFFNEFFTNFFFFPPPLFIFQVFRARTPPEAISLVSRLLEYTPSARITPLQACAHPFFAELRESNQRLASGRELPPLFNFTENGKFFLSFLHFFVFLPQRLKYFQLWKIVFHWNKMLRPVFQ